MGGARRLAAVVGLALAVAAVSPAAANGRFPRSVKLLFKPGDPDHVVAGMTFGVLISRDAGVTWRWVCESAIGFEGTFDPDYELSATGTIFANTSRGLRIDRDGCRWDAAAGPLGSTNVTALAIGPDGAVWAGNSDTATGDSQLYRSDDDGVTFAPILAGADGDEWTSIDVSPDDAQRVMVAGYRISGGGSPERVLYRSLDRGAHWDELPTTAFVGTDSSELYGVALHGETVFLRVTNIGPTIQEAIYRSPDFWTATTPTWTKVLDLQNRITSVVVRAGGTEVLATTPSMGLHRSTDGGATFSQVPDVLYDAWCLAERPGGELWMCSNNLPPDNASIVVSTTAAAGTWQTRLVYRTGIVGPVRCDPGTPQHDTCEAAQWCNLKDSYQLLGDEIDCMARDAGVDAGPGDGGGKSCCSTGRGPGLEVGVVALGLALLGRRRRRDQRARRSR